MPNPNSATSLQELIADDKLKFQDAVISAYDGKNPSYAIKYEGTIYRIERSATLEGTVYCARQMPKETPNFTSLGFAPNVAEHFMNLSSKTGLILWSGATGTGKTTSISALLKHFLNVEGGFAYTVEDPAEMPLEGTYKNPAGGIGVCTQTKPINDQWGESIKSALRSHPRFIYVGEIRTPDCASEVLRAATSGHLVLSSIHANNISDAINSVVKYAAASNMSEALAYDLFSRGMLAVTHQTLVGLNAQKRPSLSYLFANPNYSSGCQVRAIIKSGNLNLATPIETQMTRMMKGMPLFDNV